MSVPSFAVITISDTCHVDASKDRSGPRLVQLLSETYNNARIHTDILPDEQHLISSKLEALIGNAELNISLIITTGGTGFAPRDVTPEATKQIIQKDCPQLTMAIALASLQKTKFAILSRGVCGIANKTLILNFPGSEKAVVECFEVVKDLLPHALQLIGNELSLVQSVHAKLQQNVSTNAPSAPARHICPHKTGAGGDRDRNSPFAMIEVDKALQIIFNSIQQSKDLQALLQDFKAPVNIPPFRASIKDGYAMRSSGFSGTKKVVGCISAGDEINSYELAEDECFKINTGAALPLHADCVIQIEDTQLLKRKKNGDEDLVEIMTEPKPNLDVRAIGSDLSKGTLLFPSADYSSVVVKSIMASVGQQLTIKTKPKIAIVSTGSELLPPSAANVQTQTHKSQIFDSNTTMLQELLQYFGFEVQKQAVLSDDFEAVKSCFTELYNDVDFVICSGGVSMGDKDYIKPVLKEMGFEIQFGRVNMKPGKPMTFASKNQQFFFGLPGNPVSAYVTFHLFALPAIRWYAGWQREKCGLATIMVELDNDNIALDPRPEYMRASITSRNGKLYANINGNQMSSRLQSIVGADVLLHLPGYTASKPCAQKGDVVKASILRYDFISAYE